MNNVFIEISGLTDEQMRQKKPRRDVSELRQMVWFLMVAHGSRVCDICREYNYHRSTLEYAIGKFDLFEMEVIDARFEKKRKVFLDKQITEIN